MVKKINGWHFVNDSRTLAHCGLGVEAGYVYTEDGPIDICRSGLHASRRIYDALNYAPGSILCKVQLWGDVQEQEDKLVSRNREVLAVRNVESELRMWACWCVRHTPLGDGRTTWDLLTDERSRNVLEVAEQFTLGKSSHKQLYDAWAAARVAAWAARDAWAAAGDTAGAAAWAAAGAAAGASAWDVARAARVAAEVAARDAARVAAREFQSNELNRRMKELFS